MSLRDREPFVNVLIRHFGEVTFHTGRLFFNYDGTLFPVHRVDARGIYYGAQSWLMSIKESHWKILKVDPRRNLCVGTRIVIHIERHD